MTSAQVFISHRRADSEQAKNWANFLKRYGISSYVDILDPILSTLQGSSLSLHLHDRIQNSTHLLVVFSKVTAGSEWVPFEIGLATALDIGIATNHLGGNLPEYLHEWPVLSRQADYKAFVDELKAYGIQRSLAEVFKSIDVGTGRYSEGFHQRLKSQLGQ